MNDMQAGEKVNIRVERVVCARFENVLMDLRDGMVAARAGWTSEYIFMVNGGGTIDIENPPSKDLDVAGYIRRKIPVGENGSFLMMRRGGRLTPFVVSNEDLFAEDWIIGVTRHALYSGAE